MANSRVTAAMLAGLAVAGLIAACGDSDGGGNNVCAGKAGTAGTHQMTVDVGGVQRTFQVTAPDSALQGRPVPLVMVYHGVLADAESIQTLTEFPEKAAEEGFITAAGDGIGRSWNAGVCCAPASTDNVDDVAFTRAMVAAIEADYCIDTTRRYATGFSNGAAMVFRLACETTDLFAAFGPVAGSLALPSCQPPRPRPLQMINNVTDPIVRFALGTFSFGAFLDFNDCSDTREMTEPDPTTSCTTAPECAEGVTVSLCGVEGTSHQWPGDFTDTDGTFEATDYIWDFFSGEHD